MAADPNIFQQYLKPVRSVQDYTNDMNASESNALTLAGQRQSAADEQALRTAYQQSGGDQNKLMQALQAGGQYKAAQALQDKMLTQKKTQSDIDLAQAHVENSDAQTAKTAQETKFAAISQHAQDIAGIRTPQDIATYLDQGIAKGIFPAEQRDAMMQKAAQYPTVEAFKQAATQNAIPVVERAKMEAENSRNAANNARITSEGAANRGVTIRGQNMTDARAKAAADASPDALLPDATVKMMAQQYLAGDTSVMQNLGRGAQGAQNIIRLRNEIANQTTASGKGGADLAAQNAEYFGTKAGQRTAGTRIANVEMAANEAESLIPLAQQASAQVARSGLLPFGKMQVMFDNQTNDPNLRQFAAANNALVNVYSRAISPSGVPTVADKEHAREMIGTAIDHNSYMAVTQQMQKEITAARSAPQAVRKAFNAAVTGKGESAPSAIPSGWSVKEH